MELIKINLENQHLQALKTTKVYYKKKIAEETNKEKKLIYQKMLEDLCDEEEKILANIKD